MRDQSKLKISKSYLYYFIGSGLAVCCILALVRIFLHLSTMKNVDSRKFITKCGCLQLAMENLGFDKLIKRLDGQQHYEKYETPRPLNSIVPDYCVDVVDDLDMKNTTEMDKMDPKCFRQVMSPAARKLFAKEAYYMIQQLQSIGVWIAMSQGTLIGSMRAHGFMPWDDDFDFMVLDRDRAIVDKKLVELAKQKGIKFKIDYNDNIGRYKVRCDSEKYWCGMIIDVWYTDLYPTYLDNYSGHIPIEDVLPLTTRPFEGYWFPSPARADHFLKVGYGSDYFGECVFHNHMYKSMGPEFEEDCPHLPCSKLKWRKEFPHVEFCHLESGWTLELYINERQVHSVYLYPNGPN